MFEFLALPAVALAAALIPKRKLKDKEKIRRVLENANVSITKNDHSQYPQLIREYHSDTYSTYIYSLPFGLHSDSFIKQLPSISESLNKEVEFDLIMVCLSFLFIINLCRINGIMTIHC